MKPELYILGSNSATPTRDRHPTAQILRIGSSKIMIDCGEGTQNQLLKYGLRHTGITHICISHLHGDHYFGLIGLLSSMSLSGRKDTLYLIGPPALNEIINLQITHGGISLNFSIDFIATNPNQPSFVTQTNLFSIESFPLKHRIHCTGFLIKELPKELHINLEAIQFYKVPVSLLNDLKKGADFITENGETIANHLLTTPAHPSYSYAFCSDTIYDPEIVHYIKNVDLLYHEATFMKNLEERAQLYYHSTAEQAGKIAQQANVKKLIIGHFSSRYDNLEMLLKEAQEVFENTVLAIEGNMTTIGE